MRRRVRLEKMLRAAGALCAAACWPLIGCQADMRSATEEWTLRQAIEGYQAMQSDRLEDLGGPHDPRLQALDYSTRQRHNQPSALRRLNGHATSGPAEVRWDERQPAGPAVVGFVPLPLGAGPAGCPVTLGTFGESEGPDEQAPTTQAVGPAFEVPEGYWRRDIWEQMGYEFGQIVTRDFWKGFKTSFWDLENALVLTAGMGASITIRETGVDDTIRERARGHRQLGDMDETIQILGHPGTHFAATGALWLGSALAKDVKNHEVAQALAQALAVNGATTLVLKVATNTRGPDGEHYAWPSGHVSSTFTVAAVLNEYYGPWVGLPSLALAGLVGYQRIDSGVHDFSDVVFGGFLGYVVGSSIAREGKAEFPELFGMNLIPYADPQTGASGLALYKQW